MATRPLPEPTARSPEIVAEPIAPPPSAIAAVLAESRRMSPPPPQALPSKPTLFLRPAAEPLPDPAADAEPSQHPTFLHYLFLATCGVVALVAVLVLADHSRKPAGDHHVGSLLTGTAHLPKPSADGEPLQPQLAHPSRTPAPTQAYSEPNPPDSAASPDTSAQPAPTDNDRPSPTPAEPPETDPSPVDAQPTPAPPADSPTATLTLQAAG
jgi:hypothetical protein